MYVIFIFQLKSEGEGGSGVDGWGIEGLKNKNKTEGFFIFLGFCFIRSDLCRDISRRGSSDLISPHVRRRKNPST